MFSILPDSESYQLYLTGRDADGKYQIGSISLNENFNLISEHPGNPLLTKGRVGCFDCNGLCMPSVVRITDSVLYMYYAGWGLAPRGEGLYQNRCGLAISGDNGTTWQRWSESPLELIDNQDPIGIGTVFVLRETSSFWRMWYTTFREWTLRPDNRYWPYYHIKYAESDDGIHWSKRPNNIAIDFIDNEFALGRPMVVKESDGYRMWFSTRSFNSTYRIGYAESDDGIHWERRPSNIEPSQQGWDSEMVAYAYVIKAREQYIMFYNGNGFGASGLGMAVGPTAFQKPHRVQQEL